jgi:hypothetical protein
LYFFDCGLIGEEGKLVIIHLDALGVQKVENGHLLKLLAIGIPQQNLLHEQEFSVGFELEGVLDCLVVFHAHQLHILLFSYAIRHLFGNLGVFLVHVVDM